MKPKLPITIWLLPIVIVIALIALGMAAYQAFRQVASHEQALASALVIEFTAVVEAITLIRGRNWIAIGGMGASILVSGTYNYIQAQQAGKLHGLTNWWQLTTLAVGPLVALTFLSMTLGRELGQHEQAVKAYEAEQERQRQREREKRETQERERETRQQQYRKEQEERQAAQELEKEKLRLQAETDQERIRQEEARKLELAKLRTERKLTASGNGKLPETFRDWRSLPEEDKNVILELTTAEISQRYGVSERTARNWKHNAAVPLNGNGKH